MENASKALLIAGAVLIAILIIGFGITIFKSTSGVTNSVTKVSESMSVSTFNAQFTGYIGNHIPRVQVKELLSTINASNATDSKHKVNVSFNPTSSEVIKNFDQILNRLNDPFYNVSVSNRDNGYIESISIRSITK